jgi:hypothetical protein
VGVGGFGIAGRRVVAVLLVLALTGSALAVTQQRLYRGGGDGDLEASGVETVQQHSVFVEIVVEEQDVEQEIHEFGAVVGLIKECKKVRNVLDNAVLWFNDQFLFGEKQIEEKNVTEDALGFNPQDNDLMQTNGETGRWGGCFTPDGFALAIGADYPFGVGYHDDDLPDREECLDHQVNDNQTCVPPNDNMDVVKQLIDLDNRCQGCIFEYQSSFFITDPNYPNSFQDVRWLVDKFVYPLSVMGNVFQEGEDNVGNQGECSSGNGTIPISDPRDNYPHHDRCEDDVPRNNHECSQDDEDDCRPLPKSESDGEETDKVDTTVVEPLYSVHLQVDWTSPEGMGFIDKAPWEYETGASVKGMPISEDEDDPAYTKCKSDPIENHECSIEYNFVLAVDFAAFDDTEDVPGENEVDEDGARHGEGQRPQPDAHEGNSHPHNPNQFSAGPNHKHDTVDLDIFFHEQAPHFVMENKYWDEHGSPPEMTEDCSTAANDVSDERRSAVEDRTPIVCDVDSDSSQFHAHDGTETPRPATD